MAFCCYKTGSSPVSPPSGTLVSGSSGGISGSSPIWNGRIYLWDTGYVTITTLYIWYWDIGISELQFIYVRSSCLLTLVLSCRALQFTVLFFLFILSILLSFYLSFFLSNILLSVIHSTHTSSTRQKWNSNVTVWSVEVSVTSFSFSEFALSQEAVWGVLFVSSTPVFDTAVFAENLLVPFWGLAHDATCFP